jgi:hypothetical protein
MISDAAAKISIFPHTSIIHDVPMPLSFVGVELPARLAFSSFSLVIVEIEGVREKVLARGPRCVSLSSAMG